MFPSLCSPDDIYDINSQSNIYEKEGGGRRRGGGREGRGEEMEKGNESSLPICKLQPKDNLTQRDK